MKSLVHWHLVGINDHRLQQVGFMHILVHLPQFIISSQDVGTSGSKLPLPANPHAINYFDELLHYTLLQQKKVDKGGVSTVIVSL